MFTGVVLKKTSHLVLCITLIGAGIALVGCGEKPVVATAGQPALAGGAEFSVGDYEVRYVQLTDGSKTYEYPKPVMIVPITITNKGKKPLTYSPTHKAASMSEGSTPLLYADPGAEATLPPASKTPISGVVLQKGKLAGQLTEPKSIEPGSSIKDLLVFEIPPKGLSGLILSLPPAYHNGKVPVLFRIAYTPKQAKGPAVNKLGEVIALGDVSLTVDKNVVNYIETEDTSKGKGYSAEPLLKIQYTIKNNSKESITYRPNHKVTGAEGIKLASDKEGSYKRVSFGPTTNAVDQTTGKATIKAGESLTDFTLFERPSKAVDSLLLEFPASLFEQQGIARVSMPYTFSEPTLPKALQKKEKKDDTKKEDKK